MTCAAVTRTRILVRDDLGLWVVADGLGGHAAGDFASTLIVERLGADRDADVNDFIAAIEDTLQQVNAELRAAAAQQQVDVIGSTLALLVHAPGRIRKAVRLGWRQLRVYVHENGALVQLTRDHVHGQPAGHHTVRHARAGSGAWGC